MDFNQYLCYVLQIDGFYQEECFTWRQKRCPDESTTTTDDRGTAYGNVGATDADNDATHT